MSNANSGDGGSAGGDVGVRADGSESCEVSSSRRMRFHSLLASENRDFLLTSSGDQVKIADLEGKVVGLYFSANWYPPCQEFTKVLVSVYEHLKSTGSNFEIVLVSSDETVAAFNNYLACMPWCAIPFSDLEAKRALNRKFDTEDIPCLVILQPGDFSDDETSKEGVELIYRYGAQAFPFTKERLKELEMKDQEKRDRQTLSNLLMNHDRDYLLSHSMPGQVPIASLIGKTIGLYFCAEGCSPGQIFTPKLISVYKKVKEALFENMGIEDFEIVFISTDHDQTTFDSYSKSLPWPALPFGDPNIKNLTKHFDVRGVPSLVILGPDGKTITKQGRNLINLYQENAYPFTEAKLGVLEKQMDEEAESLPRSVFHKGHRHELTLVSEGTGGGPFVCCNCCEQGSVWAYQCLECGFEIHPRCVDGIAT
uniref:protein-disulfide reductase n=2 Tax=Kalanchoe fedtschenkoi TaxID=63787 RepID=A0A7N0UJF5_KALFE